MQKNIAESLISTIQKRELSINNVKIELIKQWIAQGEDLLRLQEQLQCSQNDLTKLTGISNGTVHIYIRIAEDTRILECIQGAHHGEQLIKFNQKQLLGLTKQDDTTFEASINAGQIVSTSQGQVIDVEITESSIDEKIHEKEESINKLKNDVIKLRKERSSTNAWGPKPVVQIDNKGEIIARYPSAQGAQRITGIQKSSIGSVCRGTLKTAGGFRWEFTALF